MRYRMDETAQDMLASGEWARVGPSHYRHMSGIEIERSKSGRGWVVSSRPKLVWPRLWVARDEALKDAAKLPA